MKVRLDLRNEQKWPEETIKSQTTHNLSIPDARELYSALLNILEEKLLEIKERDEKAKKSKRSAVQRKQSF